VTETIELLNSFLAFAPIGAPPPGVQAATVGGAGSLEINSLFDFVIKGGWAMIPIGLCSLVALAIIAERFLVVRRARVIPRGFVEQLREVSHDRNPALEYCRDTGSPLARLLAVAIKRSGQPIEQIEKHVEEAGGREVVNLRKHMRLLSSLPQVSTMLGLLGTVFGMIKTFQAVAATSEALGKTEMLAKGIFEAWTCTAAGLLVAVPVLVAYHYLMGKIDAIVGEIDEVAVDWVEGEKTRAPAPADARRPAADLAAKPLGPTAIAPA
jgi:biopolymer transport protein ExbB